MLQMLFVDIVEIDCRGIGGNDYVEQIFVFYTIIVN